VVLKSTIMKAKEAIKDEPLVSHAELFLKNVREIYQLSYDLSLFLQLLQLKSQ